LRNVFGTRNHLRKKLCPSAPLPSDLYFGACLRIPGLAQLWALCSFRLHATRGFVLRQPRASSVRRTGGSRTAPTQQEASPPDNESDGRAAEELSKLVGLEAGADTPSSVCDSGQGSEAPPSLRETQTPNGGGLRQPASATQTESQKDKNALQTPKSPEQSQNVIENKRLADCPDPISKDRG
jgi:hypothetical protein